MTDEKRRSRYSATGVKITLVAAGIAAGAIGATAIGASAVTAGTGSTASTSSSSTSGSSSTSSAPAPGNGAPRNDHGSAPVRSDEKALSDTLAAKLKAAALKAVPGGTVYRVETDAGDATYEVHMTKSDGTEVTAKFDKNGNVTKVESGMGLGDPAPSH